MRVPHPVSPVWNMPETTPILCLAMLLLNWPIISNMCLLLGVLGHLKDDPEDVVFPHLNTTYLPLGFHLPVAFVLLVNSLQLGTF